MSRSIASSGRVPSARRTLAASGLPPSSNMAAARVCSSSATQRPLAPRDWPLVLRTRGPKQPTPTTAPCPLRNDAVPGPPPHPPSGRRWESAEATGHPRSPIELHRTTKPKPGSEHRPRPTVGPCKRKQNRRGKKKTGRVAAFQTLSGPRHEVAVVYRYRQGRLRLRPLFFFLSILSFFSFFPSCRRRQWLSRKPPSRLVASSGKALAKALVSPDSCVISVPDACLHVEVARVGCRKAALSPRHRHRLAPAPSEFIHPGIALCGITPNVQGVSLCNCRHAFSGCGPRQVMCEIHSTFMPVSHHQNMRIFVNVHYHPFVKYPAQWASRLPFSKSSQIALQPCS